MSMMMMRAISAAAEERAVNVAACSYLLTY